MYKKVSQKEFYNFIGEKDVTVTPKGDFPYKTVFALRNGEQIGHIQDHHDGFSSYYYIKERENEN